MTTEIRRFTDDCACESITFCSITLEQPGRGEQIESVAFDPAVKQSDNAFGAAMNHKVAGTSDMDDQPVRDRVVDGVNGDGQIPGPCAGVDHPADLESESGGQFDGDHRSIKSGRRPKASNLLLPERPAFREANRVKPDTGQNAGFKLVACEKCDPAFDRSAFFTEKTGLISDAQERVQPISGIEKRVCPTCLHPK